MSHKAVRDFISDKAKALGDNIKFGYGKASDFNQIKDKKYPYVWLDPLSSSVNPDENFVETYNINLVFYKFDAPDSTQDEYKLILDQCDKLVQEFLRRIDEDLDEDITEQSLTERFYSQNIGISGITKTPVIKVTADCLTGFTLNLSLTVPDTFNYCSIYD